MKSQIHVFSRMFTKKTIACAGACQGNSAKFARVNVFLFLLFTLFASTAWAENVTENDQQVVPPCGSDKIASVAKGVTSFKISTRKYGGVGGGCNAKLYVSVPSGYAISISGDVSLRNSASSLKIYDGGNGTSSYSLYEKTGRGSYTVPTLYTSADIATVYFPNDGDWGDDNMLDLNVSVVPRYAIDIPSPSDVWVWNPYTSERYKGNVSFPAGMTVSLGVKLGLTYLRGLKVKKTDGSIVPVTPLTTGNELQFTMPSSPVTVTAIYSESEYNLLFPEKTLNLASEESFKLYDNGGSDAQYTNNFDSWLVLNAPDNEHRIKVEGTIKTEANFDFLEIYDGVESEGTSSTSLCKKSGSLDIGVWKSSGRSMTIHFSSDNTNVADGLDLTVTAEQVTYAVNLIQGSNGSISSDLSKAGKGKTVTLTAKPSSGYVLKSVSVINVATGAAIATSGGWETGNKVTFTMPASEVRVTPTFVTDTYSITKSTTTGGSITVASSAKVGTSVSITATPATGYMLKDIVVKDANNNIIGNDIVKHHRTSLTSWSFTMPIGNVTVTPNWTKDLSVDGGLYIEMSKTGTVNATVPAGVKSFKVYDDGGSSNNYSKNSNGTLVLTAPTGYVFELTGSVKTGYTDSYYTCNANDNLSVYDGSSTSATALVSAKIGCTASNGPSNISLGRIVSHGNTMTLKFKSDGTGTVSDGLNLTVTLRKLALELADDGNGNKYVDMVAKHTATLNISEGVASFNVYDNGGKYGDYIKGANDTLVLTAPKNYVFELTGHVKTGYTKATGYDPVTYTCNTNDNLSVYDGSSTSAAALVSAKTGCMESYGPSNISLGRIVSQGNTMTLVFKSNGTGYASSGLDLTVTLRKLALELADDDLGNKYVDMVAKHKATLTVPEGIASFNVYDNGGKYWDYMKAVNDTLVLTAPTNYVFELTGHVNTGYTSTTGANPVTYTCNTNDNLSVYDGSSTSAAALVSAKIGCTELGPSNISLGRIASQGNTMTLVFKSNGNGYASDGLNLTVKLRKLALELADDGNGNKYVDMVAKRKATLTIPEGIASFNVYDDGGKSGDYMKAVNDTLVLTAPSGYVLQLTGSIYTGCSFTYDYITDKYTYTCNANDNLSVYDGSSTTSTVLLQNKTSDCTINKGPKSTSLSEIQSSGQSMTLVFKSDATGNSASGLDLTVTLVPLEYAIQIEDVSNGKVLAKTTAHVGETVSLTSVPTTSGYMLKDVEVKDVSGNIVKVSQYSFSVSEFIMPAKDVEVTPTFTNNLTAAGGLHLDMRKNVDFDPSFTESVQSFKIYDNGGMSGAYEANSDDILRLAAPQGYRMKLTGYVTLEKGADSLYVFDGSSFETKLFGGTSSSNNVKTSIGELFSSDNHLTLHFKSNASTQYDGLDLTVTLISPSEVSVAPVDGGSVSSDKETAAEGETVTLTAIPDDGYLIDGVVVKDADNNVIALNNDIYWYCDTTKVSFKMPSSSVTVTPKFSPINALSVNMPKKGEVRRCDVNIPENVTTFKIYDDGGKDCDYSIGAVAELWVLFDKKSGNAGLKLSGSVAAKDGARLELSAWTDDGDIETFYTYKGSSDGHAEDIGTFINSTSLVIYFATGNVGSAAGLDLRVDVIKSPGAGVDVVFDDARVIGDCNFKRCATITDGDKISTLNITEDVFVDTVSFTRVFKKNTYSTIVFPFDVSASNLEGVAKVLRFNGFKQLEDKSWAVRMKRVWTPDTTREINLNANYPYLVVMNEEKLIVHEGVTLKKTVEPIAMAEGCNWKFIGTLAYMDMPEGNSNVYGFQDNKFVRAGENSYVNPLRAYLLKPNSQQPKGMPGVDGTVYARTAIASIDDTPDEFYIVEDEDESGEHTTIVGRYNVRTGEFKMLRNYDLNGRKLNGKPAAHKAYYGKKVVK